ncbi:TetR family transcriptional regulator [Shinella sp. AETb1-6]|uniref:TetR/AcrR family transcriptional regulator n=1 Tax=Shinella sumterensis TaxID=1967501 RepID=A0AA50D4W4_9HYPH|nr:MULTISPECIES: TetR/AcrR family transcriptional regulator [Shinella]MDP9591041.1 AcrR family transcriptional regulator [Shinella zoogloeoides]MXN50106.1 TetR family transcriptional regulator [Shinella sp. AETb1-6]WLR97831.1 TetR/AcrR family transcriptional regulator [Shinella sumterensis]WLS07619.1 TetR/AcrR family transcriptional regulator [Shinella sumterensis]
MSKAHHRKKHPEAVRRQVLAVAARLSLEKGPASVTLDAVSQAAGVSKGGLLHHFPNKLSLLDGLFDDVTQNLDRVLAERMKVDPEPKGRFTRAYIAAFFQPEGLEDGERWKVLTVALISEPHLRDRWREWFDRHLVENVGTDSSLDATLARYAVDGLWLDDLLGVSVIDTAMRATLLKRLLDMSRL